ncbi:MAG: helix-turn-helix domain-containing protein [Nanoarchaeota archaeon]|nr:helix-turn-helix domain-containing protein [Nanoarchaeota archaeon]
MTTAEIKSTLQDFGLTENEAEIYLILLKLGSATASEITQKSKIHRINIYDILERLQEKGLVSYVIIGKRKSYEAVEPKKILEIEEERKRRIEEILPELSARRATGKENQEATIFKDKKGIKNILEEITKSKTDVYLFASGWGFEENFPDYSDVWHERFRINKVKIKCLISSKFKNLKIPGPLDYRFLPSEFVFPSTTCIYEDKVLIIMWSNEPIGILIRGKDISESYKKFFQMLWKVCK